MTKEELQDRIQIAISNPENWYKTPYARTTDGKDSLHIWMIDSRKASEKVANLLLSEELKPDFNALFKEWCKETKRSGGVLVGSSIRELLNYLKQNMPT